MQFTTGAHNSTETKHIQNFVERYARAKGYALNPNPDELQKIIHGLLSNEKEYGYRYCPCRQITGNIQEDATKICPCKWHMDEIEKQGTCHCKLFWKKE